MFIEKYTFYLYSRHLLYIVFLINVVVGINVFWENFLENVISVVYQINMLMDFWGGMFDNFILPFFRIQEHFTYLFQEIS